MACTSPPYGHPQNGYPHGPQLPQNVYPGQNGAPPPGHQGTNGPAQYHPQYLQVPPAVNHPGTYAPQYHQTPAHQPQPYVYPALQHPQVQPSYPYYQPPMLSSFPSDQILFPTEPDVFANTASAPKTESVGLADSHWNVTVLPETVAQPESDRAVAVAGSHWNIPGQCTQLFAESNYSYSQPVPNIQVTVIAPPTKPFEPPSPINVAAIPFHYTNPFRASMAPDSEEDIRLMGRADALELVANRPPVDGPPRLQRAKPIAMEHHRVPQANETRPYGLQRADALGVKAKREQTRPVYFKVRKVKILDTVNPQEWEHADPNSRIFAKAQDLEKVKAITRRHQRGLISKMHWALQVGEGDEEQTYELQVDSGMISAVVGKWTKKELDQQPSWAKESQFVGYTTLNDEELKNAAIATIKFMQYEWAIEEETQGMYHEIYCNCHHFVFLFGPAILANGDTSKLFTDPPRLPYKWETANEDLRADAPSHESFLPPVLPPRDGSAIGQLLFQSSKTSMAPVIYNASPNFAPPGPDSTRTTGYEKDLEDYAQFCERFFVFLAKAAQYRQEARIRAPNDWQRYPHYREFRIATHVKLRQIKRGIDVGLSPHQRMFSGEMDGGRSKITGIARGVLLKVAGTVVSSFEFSGRVARGHGVKVLYTAGTIEDDEI